MCDCIPDGDQSAAKYDGYICLGEVQVQCPGTEPKLVGIEAGFGKVEVDVACPALVALYLRCPDGRLCAQPWLAQRPAVAYGYREGSGIRRWARQGYTYVVGEDEVRYESRLAAPEKVDVQEEAGRSVLRITGVTLSDGNTTASQHARTGLCPRQATAHNWCGRSVAPGRRTSAQ